MIKDIFVAGNGGWVGAVARLGLPIVLSLILTMFLIGSVSTAQTKIIDNQQTIIKVVEDTQSAMNTYQIEDRRENGLKLQLLLQTCVNTAKNDAQHQACVSAAEVQSRR